MSLGWWQAVRLFGWFRMPFGWIWRGCFDLDAAVECYRQGWKEYKGLRLLKESQP